MNHIIGRSIVFCELVIALQKTSFGQDSGIPTGALMFEKEPNHLFARYLLKEHKAIRLLENELIYRKRRQKRYQLGTKKMEWCLKKLDFLTIKT